MRGSRSRRQSALSLILCNRLPGINSVVHFPDASFTGAIKDGTSARSETMRRDPIAESTLRLLVLSLLCAAPVAAAQDRIDANRPSFSTSPVVLQPGAWQLETGIDYQRDNTGAGSSSVTLPAASLRYGLQQEIELLFDWSGVSRVSSGGQSETGVTDASVGIKFQVSEDDAKTAFAFVADLSIPIGDAAFSSDRWNPSIGVAWANSASLTWAGTAKITNNGGDYQLDNGVLLGFATTENSTAFVEWEANIPDSGSAAHKLNGGYLWWRGPMVQFDVNASLGLNDQAADYGLGLGWSYRF
jgi:hypothetical protein